MGIEDFLVYYPQSTNSNIDDILYRKKEFYDNKLLEVDDPEKSEENNREILKYQEANARYSSILTNYDKRLIYHRMGLGKTTTAIETIELLYEQCEYLNMKPNRVLILLSNTNLIKKFKTEIFKRHPELYPIDDETSETKKNKMLGKKYVFDTYISFAQRKLKDHFNETVEMFSNTMIVCDEIHELTGMRANTNDQQIENVYKLIHLFLHRVKSSKILIMSGTPMRDSVKEISSVMNLLLDLDKQLPESNFEQHFFNENDVLKIEKHDELKQLFKNKVSFLISPTNVPFNFMLNDIQPEYKFNFLKLYYDQMSEFQTKQYLKLKSEEDNVGFRKNEQYASSFIFPDGSSGQIGFKRYVLERKTKTKKLLKSGKRATVNTTEFTLSDELKSILRPTNDMSISDRLKILKKYSCKFASAIKEILHPDKLDEVCVWFSEFVHETGTILFATILKDIFDFIPANGKVYKRDASKRQFTYSLITSQSGNITRELAWNNSIENIHAEVVKVIIGSKVMSTGYDIMNAKQMHIDTSHWNYSQTDQTISRVLRFNGNNKLIDAGIDPTVNIYLHTSVLKNKSEPTIDIDMYKISEEKDYKIKQIERIIKEVSIDCALNYNVNKIKNAKNNSRECEYQKCNYSCDGISDLTISNDDIIKDTYRLLYQNTSINAYSDVFAEELLSKQILDVHSINENEYINTKVMYSMKNDTKIMTSRLGFGCFAQTDGNTNIFLSNDTKLTNDISSWYTTFPMLSYQKSITDVLKSSTIVNDFISEKLQSIQNCESIDDVSSILNNLPSWIIESLLKSLYYNTMQKLIKLDKRWNRSNILNVNSNESVKKLLFATEQYVTVYPRLLLLDINNVVWKLKYELDTTSPLEWILQTGTQTDSIIIDIENKYKQRAVDNDVEFIGKIKGSDSSTLKILQANVERSTGRDCGTVPTYYFIYFIVKFGIKSPSYVDKFKSDFIENFILRNKDIKEFDAKFNSLSSNEWDKKTKYNVVAWLNIDNFKSELCNKIYETLRFEKLLIMT